MKYSKICPKSSKSAKPFLDRFLESDNQGHLPDLIDIIIRDVEALLNTRSPSFTCSPDSTSDFILGFGGTVLEYGLPDLTTTGKSEGELWSLALKVRKSLEHFEPRLSHIEVEPVIGADEAIDHLTVRITATVVGFENWPALNLEMPVPY